MAVYRAEHIAENAIAMVPVRGYVNSTNYSNDSIRWLDFISETEGIEIKHALNGQGEKRLGGISVDGFSEQTNTVYQYHVRIFIVFFFSYFFDASPFISKCGITFSFLK